MDGALVFNKTGKIPKLTKFYVGKDEIKITNRYKYLGTVLSTSGSFVAAKDTLCDKSIKAYFAIRKVLNKIEYSPDISLRMFDTLLQPILTYNCEIWSQFTQRQEKALKQTELLDDFVFNNSLPEVETQHLRFCKSVLGVNKSCSNLAVFGDLGRMPLRLFCYRQTLIYLHRLVNFRDNSLVKTAFKDSIQQEQKGNNNWVSYVKKLFKAFDLQFDLERLKSIKPNKFKALVSRRIKEKFDTYWRKNIGSEFGRSNKGGNKLRTYSLFKTRMHQEPYCLLRDRKHRINMAKLRCSDHNLQIETGRRSNMQVNERLCKFCILNKVEDEEHFLTECTLYSALRNRLISALEKEGYNTKQYTNRQFMIFLLSNENLKIVRLVATYVSDACELRKTSSPVDIEAK